MPLFAVLRRILEITHFIPYSSEEQNMSPCTRLGWTQYHENPRLSWDFSLVLGLPLLAMMWGKSVLASALGGSGKLFWFIFDKSSVSQQNFLHVGSVNNQRSLLRSYIFIHLLNIYWYPALCQVLKMQRWDTQSFWLAGASQVGKFPAYRQRAQHCNKYCYDGEPWL